MIARMKRQLRYFDPRRARRAQWTGQTVRLSDCVSYHGFHYGARSVHPLQNYAMSLQNGRDVGELRAEFAEFVRFYRPGNMAQAMGIEDLDAAVPMWLYPWQQFGAEQWIWRRAWRTTPAECPDILTHFSDAGIDSFRIEEECLWTERALQSLAAHGYQPARRGWIRVCNLLARDGRAAHLMLDGNHRAAALCALGAESIAVLSEPRAQIMETEVDSWPGVRNGFYSRATALRVFNRFIEGNSVTATTRVPAPILAPQGWLALYP